MAMAIYIACTYLASDLLSYVGYGVRPLTSLPVIVPAAAAALLASGSFWRLRRQAVL